MWLNLLSMGVKTASHLYKNKQRTKISSNLLARKAIGLLESQGNQDSFGIVSLYH